MTDAARNPFQTWSNWLMLTGRKARNRVWNTERLWRRSLDSELDYWRGYFATGGYGDRRFDRRLDPDAELQEPAVVQALDELPPQSAAFRILDVGAGPITSLGRVYKGGRLDIVAVDCLADEYNRLLEGAGVRPPVRTQQGESERLLTVVGPDSFDVAFSRNALDHSYDPMRGILNMLAAVKPGRIVVLKHGVNEAEAAAYRGLHQWNFATAGSKLLCWKCGVTIDVTGELAGRARVHSFPEDDWLVSVLRKA